MTENKNKRELNDQELQRATGGADSHGDGQRDGDRKQVEERVFDRPDTRIQKSGGDPLGTTN